MKSFAFIPAVVIGLCGSASAVMFNWVTVGNAGNAPHPISGHGAVDHVYQISKYEVTNAQYAEFLTAKATSDGMQLYSPDMASDPNGGITRSGTSGSYTYAVKPGYANRPVTFVSWYDSIRFANWIHNGQGAGSTETGAYTIASATQIPSNGTTIARNPGALVFLPNESEWYKAGYHQPGAPDGYWLYPTRTNAMPASDNPASLQNPTNSANYFNFDGVFNGINDGFAVTGSDTLVSTQNYLTDVGAYTQTFSFYGTFDQAGNVSEWTEAYESPIGRLIGSGGWGSTYGSLMGVGTASAGENDSSGMGFRLASVPEPTATMLLPALGAMLAVRRARRASVDRAASEHGDA